MTATELSLIIFNIICWIVFFIIQKIRTKKMIYEVQQISLGNIKQEVDKLLIEIDKVTDRDLSIIENRIKTLREVIELADKRILLSEREEQKRAKEIEAINRINTINSTVKKDNSSVKSYAENAYKANKKLHDDGGISLFPAEDFEKTVPKPKVEEKSIKDKVLELFNQGIDIYLIAEKLETSVAEVQTIVNLFGN